MAESVVKVPEGWIFVPRELEAREHEELAAGWAQAMRTGTVPVLAGGMRFVQFSPEAAIRMKARRYLSNLGKLEHPSADEDPVGALGQVAVDYAQALALVPSPDERERREVEVMRGHFNAARDVVTRCIELSREEVELLVRRLNDVEAGWPRGSS